MKPSPHLRIAAMWIATLPLGAAAQTVFVHGKIWTENTAQPEAEAVYVVGDRIVAVGTSEKVLQHAGADGKVIDLHGRRMLPGFNDAHVHFYAGSANLSAVDGVHARSPQEFATRVRDFVGKTPKGDWITDGAWDQENWPGAPLPTHELLDAVSPENPVALERVDGHAVLANSTAMRLSGITRETKDVPGGVIVRDAQGNPTGVFKDAAMALVESHIPPPSLTRAKGVLMQGMRYAAEHGVTSAQNMAASVNDHSTPMLLRALQELRREGKLTVRLAVYPRLLDWREQAAVGISAGFGDAMLHIGGVKGFSDGSLGSRTAWMLAPYADDASTSGIASAELLKPAEMYGDVQGADAAGLQVVIHAIGDRANREILNFYDRAQKQNPAWDRRFRIEHAQHLNSSDIPRFGQLHVIASMQPYHTIDDGRWAVKRLGAARLPGAYPWRSLLDSGATLVFGSDWPVAPMDPLLGIYAAATRRTIDGKNPQGWVPEQRITVREAIHAYTLAAAYAEYQDKEKGSIEPGKLADFVVLSDDILNEDPVLIEKTHVEMTVLGGRVLYGRTPSR